MSAEIDPALADKLRRRPTAPIEVELEFTQAPPAGQLETLGLESEGLIAWGPLTTEKIEAIASIPQVKAIRLSRRPTRASPSGSPQSRIGMKLRLEMEDRNQREFNVTVVFRAPLAPGSEIAGLSIHEDMGSGRLTREQITALAARDDVLSIESPLEMGFH